VSVMAGQNPNDERRKFRRVPVGFPTAYTVHGTIIPGWALNACNEGMMVESFMSLDMALHILYWLKKRGTNHLVLEFTHKGTYRTEAEIKHFHLQFLGRTLCRSQIGFFMPKIRQEVVEEGKPVDPGEMTPIQKLIDRRD